VTSSFRFWGLALRLLLIAVDVIDVAQIADHLHVGLG